MVYKKYYINVIFRVLLILLNCLIITLTIVEKSYLYTNTFLIMSLIFQVILLIRYINISNVFLERFLIYIKENNTTINFSNSLKDTPFKQLSSYFEEINTIIQSATIEKENQYQYLQYIFDHVNIGLIAFNENLEVDMINTAAKDILNIKSLGNLKALNKIDSKLLKSILNLELQYEITVPVVINNKTLQLAIKLSKFKLLNNEISLVSMQDIKSELDKKEIESWQKLNRVLTHEIMNSVSPIIGLTNNVSKLLTENGENILVDNINQKDIDQTVQSVSIIEERSIGLNKFVKNFRSITTDIKPEPIQIKIYELFEDLSLLMHESLNKHDINFRFNATPDSLEFLADRKLIEQVLINLIKNSIEAFKTNNNKQIELNAYKNQNRTIIEVIDNGEGIPSDKIDLIFTPFYTTKKEGSGIGLSLTKNILKQHGCDIDVHSVPNEKTTFTLYF